MTVIELIKFIMEMIMFARKKHTFTYSLKAYKREKMCACIVIVSTFFYSIRCNNNIKSMQIIKQKRGAGEEEKNPLRRSLVYWPHSELSVHIKKVAFTMRFQ